jgi:hypothetical protein
LGDGPRFSQDAVLVPAGAVPAPWRSTLIGLSATKGGAVGYDAATGQYALRAVGDGYHCGLPQNKGAAPDSFAFVYQPVRGDATISAQILEHGGIYPGVMFRNGGGDRAAYVFGGVGPYESPGPRYVVNVRATDGTGAGIPQRSDIGALPWWVRMQRVGNKFLVGISKDKVKWQEVASRTLPPESAPEEMLAGFLMPSGCQPPPATGVVAQPSLDR